MTAARATALALLASAVGGAPPAFSGEAPSARPESAEAATGAPALGLREAIGLASRRDPRVAVAAARRRAAQAQRDDALLGYAPDVLLGAAFTTGFPGSGSDLQLRGMLGSPFYRHYVAGVDASWNLVELLRTPVAADAAEAGIDAADAGRATAEREVALAIIDLFERILTAAETRRVLEAESEARRGQMGAVRTRVEAGTVAREQLLQAEAGLADVEAEIATAVADERSARKALRAVIDDDRALAAPLRMEIPGTGKELPEIRMARAWRLQAEKLETLERLELVPRFTVAGSAGYANPPLGAKPGLYAVGAAVAVPLTGAVRERKRRQSDVARAEARALEADATTEMLAARTAEIDGAIAGLEAAESASERSRQAAFDALAAVTARAEAGTVPEVDVEAARAVLRRADTRNRMLRLRVDGLKARRAFSTTNP